MIRIGSSQALSIRYPLNIVDLLLISWKKIYHFNANTNKFRK